MQVERVSSFVQFVTWNDELLGGEGGRGSNSRGQGLNGIKLKPEARDRIVPRIGSMRRQPYGPRTKSLILSQSIQISLGGSVASATVRATKGSFIFFLALL